jgi:hypothetical protein
MISICVLKKVLRKKTLQNNRIEKTTHIFTFVETFFLKLTSDKNSSHDNIFWEIVIKMNYIEKNKNWQIYYLHVLVHVKILNSILEYNECNNKIKR